jgi:hypothetical protein
MLIAAFRCDIVLAHIDPDKLSVTEKNTVYSTGTGISSQRFLNDL